MPEVKFCGECGVRLKNTNAHACLSCGAEPAKATKFCVACGSPKASPNAIICTKCGEKFTLATEKKDPGIAALIAVLGMFILAAPAIGYIYLGNVRKGLIYIIANWILVGAITVVVWIGFFGLTATTIVGGVCCLPAAFIPLFFAILIVYDVYLEAKGEKPKLPSF